MNIGFLEQLEPGETVACFRVPVVCFPTTELKSICTRKGSLINTRFQVLLSAPSLPPFNSH